MKLFRQLRSSLNNKFEGIELTQPLLFKGLPGLRFELQNDVLETSDDIYFEEVVNRMNRIHAVTTGKDDNLLILLQRDTPKRSKIRKCSYLFKQLNKATAIYQFRRSKTPIYHEKGDFKAYKSCRLI